MILGIPVLEQGSLEGLFVSGSGYVDFFSRSGVDPGVIHAGREGARGRIEILHLLGNEVVVPKVLGQFDGCGKVASGMTGNEVGYEVLFLFEFLINPAILLFEPSVYFKGRFPHRFQYPGVHVLRSYLQLTRYMELAELTEEGRIRVSQQVVVADSRTDKYSLYPGEGTEFSKQLQVVLMVDVQIRTGCRDEA